jgi:pimeloyl-ACP methyl ester carboxylesterase
MNTDPSTQGLLPAPHDEEPDAQEARAAEAPPGVSPVAPTDSVHQAHAPRHQRFPRWLLVTLGVVVTLGVLGGGIGALVAHVTRQAGLTAAFQTAACPFTPPAGVVVGRDLRCGYLTVPEDHARPQGRTIQLAVAIYKSLDPSPAPDPLLVFNGGPGTPLLEYDGPALTPSLISSIWTSDRDVILVDQRGVGYSRPSLACTGTEDVRACHDRLVRDGIDLNAYDTIQNAEDVHDLVHALGFRQVNLYGVSYGTRLELTVMRLFPADLRSVVLDSTSPPQVDIDSGWPAATQRAFDTLFQGCAASAYCNQHYPHLQAVFAQLVTSLNQHPATVQATNPQTGQLATATMTGDNVIEGLRNALYDTALIPQLPQLIYQFANGDYSQGAAVAQAAQANQGSDSVGMALSVDCSETTMTPQAVPAAVQNVAPETRQYYLSGYQDGFATCQLWHVQPVPAAQHQPVTSAIPTLIFAGEYDPATAPAYGMLAARTLSRSYYFEFPGTGHVVLGRSSCSTSIFQQFVELPTQRPDASCLSSISEPLFV